MAIKIPGVTPFLRAIFLSPFAASLGISLSRRLSDWKKDHSTDGMVKVTCCQGQGGSIDFCLAIHLSVAVLPQILQALSLQLNITRLVWVQVAFEQT